MYLLGMKYLEALPQITQGKGTTIFLPAEAAGVMGALGGLKELVARGGLGSGAAGPPPSAPSPTKPPQLPAAGKSSDNER